MPKSVTATSGRAEDAQARPVSPGPPTHNTWANASYDPRTGRSASGNGGDNHAKASAQVPNLKRPADGAKVAGTKPGRW